MRQLAVVNDYDGLLAALRTRAQELKVSRETIDAISGIQSGYASKLLAPVPLRALGPVSFGPVLQSLGLALVVVEDLDALNRVKDRFEPQKRRTVPGDTRHEVITIRISRRKLRRMQRKGGQNRLAKLTPKQLRKHQQRAARIRWRKYRQAQ